MKLDIKWFEDFDINSPQDGDVLVYDGVSGRFVNDTIAGGGGGGGVVKQTLSNAAATVNWNVANGQVAVLNMDALVQPYFLATPTNAPEGETLTLIIKQDASGQSLISFSSAIKFAEGEVFVPASGPNAISVLSMIHDNGVFYATGLANFF